MRRQKKLWNLETSEAIRSFLKMVLKKYCKKDV
ncbi:MAG: hypothetical protein BWY13_01001 [Euryarchaeota archaeon ADurb.Bin190]|nr:MAG: hypothetical protein BWY13_01001 [Euryarchaeota archaeon ADurb.Bin190]